MLYIIIWEKIDKEFIVLSMFVIYFYPSVYFRINVFEFLLILWSMYVQYRQQIDIMYNELIFLITNKCIILPGK